MIGSYSQSVFKRPSYPYWRVEELHKTEMSTIFPFALMSITSPIDVRSMALMASWLRVRVTTARCGLCQAAAKPAEELPVRRCSATSPKTKDSRPYTTPLLSYRHNVRPSCRIHRRQARCHRAPGCPGPQLRQQHEEM